jgi:hypothetical protein
MITNQIMDITKLVGEITLNLMKNNMTVIWPTDRFFLQKFKHHTTMNCDFSNKLKSVNDLCTEFYHGTDRIIIQILSTPNGTIHIFYDFE